MWIFRHCIYHMEDKPPNVKQSFYFIRLINNFVFVFYSVFCICIICGVCSWDCDVVFAMETVIAICWPSPHCLPHYHHQHHHQWDGHIRNDTWCTPRKYYCWLCRKRTSLLKNNISVLCVVIQYVCENNSNGIIILSRLKERRSQHYNDYYYNSLFNPQLALMYDIYSITLTDADIVW